MIIARPDQRGEYSWCARKFKQVENEPGGAMPFFWRWPINKPGQERGGALLSPPSQTLPPLSSGGSALAEPTEIEELGSCFPARESLLRGRIALDGFCADRAGESGCGRGQAANQRLKFAAGDLVTFHKPISC